MGNCSCGNNAQDPQIIFEDEKQKILNNLKSKLEDLFMSIEPISFEEFEQKKYSFPNVKELFEEYNSQIYEQSQKDLPTTNQSITMEQKEKDLKELPFPIKLIEDNGEYDLFKGFINKNNYFSGLGCYITNNYLYNGYFQNNEYNGKGVMINKDGSSLYGDWVNGVCTGKGILKINNQYEYEGDFVENKKQGYGIEKYPDGSRYEGEFHDNKKTGKENI